MDQDSNTQETEQQEQTLRTKISIENFPEYEQKRYPNTPLSKEACLAVGCTPKSLLYKPPEKFKEISSDETIQKMHYNFHEANRKNLIKAVQKEKIKIAQEMKNRKQDWSITTNGFKFSSSFSARGMVSKSGNYSSRSQLQQSNNTQQTKSFHSSVNSLDQVDKAREKYLRQMQNLLNQEQKAALKMQELEKQNYQEQKMQEAAQLKKKLEEREKCETRRLLEIEKKLKAEQDEKIARQKAIKLGKKTEQENQRAEQKFMERLKRMKQKRDLAEQRRKEH